MNGRQYRFRRFDSRNFVIEEPYGKAGRYRIEGYYPSPEGMCRAAIRKGVGGNSIAQLLSSVASAYANATDALNEAIDSGMLQLPGRSPKAREKRTTTKQHDRIEPPGDEAA